MKKIEVIAILAVGNYNEIGLGDGLPWHIPKDFKHFKEQTNGHTVVMGRKTFDTLGKPLPNRKNIILTRGKKPNSVNKNVLFINNIEALTESFKYVNEKLKEPLKIFIIGGAEIYKQAFALDIVDTIIITKIHNNTEFKHDTKFDITRHMGTKFKLVSSKFIIDSKADKHFDNGVYTYSFMTFKKQS